MRRVHAPAKVCDFQLPIEPHQQVLWLDVPVNHMLGVAVRQGARQGQHIAATHRAARGSNGSMLQSRGAAVLGGVAAVQKGAIPANMLLLLLLMWFQTS